MPRPRTKSAPGITLTTDFGLTDWFVGAMKGVILGLAPRCPVIDLTHGIPSGDIRAGAFALAAGYGTFPKGTIHVAVVDPGVGSERKAIAVRTRDHVFVGPDNGVLSQALATEQVMEIRRLDNTNLFREPLSQTFHGRDLFAPVAARLSRGLAFAELGQRVEGYQKLVTLKPRITPTRVSGEIVYVDRFGNALTNLQASDLATLGDGALMVSAARRRAIPVRAFYQAVPAGKPLAILGSSGVLEIAINGGDAACQMKLGAGDTVHVTRGPRKTP